jgi:hypothetical protein
MDRQTKEKIRELVASPDVEMMTLGFNMLWGLAKRDKMTMFNYLNEVTPPSFMRQHRSSNRIIGGNLWMDICHTEGFMWFFYVGSEWEINAMNNTIYPGYTDIQLI